MHKRVMYAIYLLILSIFFLGGQGGCCCEESGDSGYEPINYPSNPYQNIPPPTTNIPPCFMCGIQGCPDCPDPDPGGLPGPGDDDDPDLPDIPVPGNTVPPGMIPTADPDTYFDPTNGKLFNSDGSLIKQMPRHYRPVYNEPNHFLNPRDNTIRDLDDNIVRTVSDSEAQRILERSIPAGTYLLPGRGYLDPTTLFVHSFDGTSLGAATQDDLDEIEGRVPEGMIDVGYGYVDPNSLILKNYNGRVIRTITQEELNHLLKRVPPHGYDLLFGYYDPNTGMIHDYYGRIRREPTQDEINQIISGSTPGVPATPPSTSNPNVEGLVDITVEEDTEIPDLDLTPFKHDDDDSPDDLTWRITSGDPDKVIVTLLSNDILRFTLIPNATGTTEVTFALEDTDGNEATHSININILPVNDAPEILSSPPLFTSTRLTYIYEIEANDIDGDDVSFTLINALDGMTIDPVGFNRAKIEWEPDSRGLSNPVTIFAQDTLHAKGFQTWQIDVR